MIRLNKLNVTLVLVFNLVIAGAYYIDNLDASYSELSSDIQNIIPVAQKFDNPQLFAQDLYLNDINNVKYYTPFYVQSLRFIAKFNNYDYVQAINVLGCFCHLVFGILWFFLLFKFVNNYWVAFLVSVIMRGVIWLPGLEIWGISDLWTIMPRTVYITLMPLPFLLISKNFKRLLFGFFLIGLVFNFHPITGLGGVLFYITLIVLLYSFFNFRSLYSIKKVLVLSVALVLGMLPFLMTYFGKTSAVITYDVNAFNEALLNRIPDYFQNGWLFLKQWLQLKTLFFALPIMVFLFISKNNDTAFKTSKILALLFIISIIVPTLSIPLERFVNEILGLNLRLSFQLVRMQKVAIVSSFFAMAFLLKHIISTKVFKFFPYGFIVYIGLLVFSQSKMFKTVPFFGDDISRTILPHNLSLFSVEHDKELAVDKMAKYIEKHTKETDLICGTYILRGATKRSTILDGKGVSMLIEGNPKAFVQWQERQKKINSLDTMDKVIDYLRQFNVAYFITRNKDVPAILVHSESNLNLYKL